MAKRVIISGRVQGVFYRAWSVDLAQSLGLRGWVRNRRDGKVEMLVDGESAEVARMIELCRQGPPAAVVESVEVEEVDEVLPPGFGKRPTQ